MDMAMVLESPTNLWSDEHEQHVIDLLKKGKTDQTLPRNEYHVLQTYDLVSMGGVEQVARKSNGKYMTTRTRALNVIQLLHRETGHGGENRTFKKINKLQNARMERMGTNARTEV